MQDKSLHAMHQHRFFTTASLQKLQKDVHASCKLIILKWLGIIFGLWQLLFLPNLANIISLLWQ